MHRVHTNELPASQETALSRAAFYGLYLRLVEGLAPDEAAAMVMERYPAARPKLERLTRPPVMDPLGERNGESGDVK